MCWHGHQVLPFKILKYTGCFILKGEKERVPSPPNTWIYENKCVFDKHTPMVCVVVVLRGTFAHIVPQLKVTMYLCIYRRNILVKVEGPLRVRDQNMAVLLG